VFHASNLTIFLVTANSTLTTWRAAAVSHLEKMEYLFILYYCLTIG